MLTLEDTIIWIKVYRYREKKEKIHKNYSKTEFVIIIIYVFGEPFFILVVIHFVHSFCGCGWSHYLQRRKMVLYYFPIIKTKGKSKQGKFIIWKS